MYDLSMVDLGVIIIIAVFSGLFYLLGRTRRRLPKCKQRRRSMKAPRVTRFEACRGVTGTDKASFGRTVCQWRYSGSPSATVSAKPMSQIVNSNRDGMYTVCKETIAVPEISLPWACGSPLALQLKAGAVCPTASESDGRYICKHGNAVLPYDTVGWIPPRCGCTSEQAKRDAVETPAPLTEAERLRAALLDLYNGTAEYIYLNNLGDPHNTTPMRRAAEVLGVRYPRSLTTEGYKREANH